MEKAKVTYIKPTAIPPRFPEVEERYAPTFVRVMLHGKWYSIPNNELLRVYIRLSHMIAELGGV